MNISATQNAAFAKLHTAEVSWKDASKHALVLSGEAEAIRKVVKSRTPQPEKAAELLQHVVDLQARVSEAQSQAKEAAELLKPAIDDLVASYSKNEQFHNGSAVQNVVTGLVPNEGVTVNFAGRNTIAENVVPGVMSTGFGTSFATLLLSADGGNLPAQLGLIAMFQPFTVMGGMIIVDAIRGTGTAAMKSAEVNDYLTSLAKVLAAHTTGTLPATRKEHKAMTNLGFNKGSYKHTFAKLSSIALQRSDSLAQARTPIVERIQHAGKLDFFEHRAAEAQRSAEMVRAELGQHSESGEAIRSELVSSLVEQRRSTIRDVAEIHTRAVSQAEEELSAAV